MWEKEMKCKGNNKRKKCRENRKIRKERCGRKEISCYLFFGKSRITLLILNKNYEI